MHSVFASKNQPPTKDANTLLILRTRPTSRQIRVFSLHRRKLLALLLRPTRVAGGCLPPWRGPAAGTSAGCRRSWTGRAGSGTRRTPRSRPCWRPRQRQRGHAGIGAAGASGGLRLLVPTAAAAPTTPVGGLGALGGEREEAVVEAGCPRRRVRLRLGWGRAPWRIASAVGN